MILSIEGLDKAELLLALYNNAKGQGDQYNSQPWMKKMNLALFKPATIEDAKAYLAKRNELASTPSADNFQFLTTTNNTVQYSNSDIMIINYINLGNTGERRLGVCLSGSDDKNTDFTQYDQYHGKGEAQKVIAELRRKMGMQADVDLNKNSDGNSKRKTPTGANQ